MKTEPIEITSLTEPGGIYVVEAVVYSGVLAIHPCTSNPNHYTVTHLNTGNSIAHFYDLEWAQVAVGKLLEMIDWRFAPLQYNGLAGNLRIIKALVTCWCEMGLCQLTPDGWTSEHRDICLKMARDMGMELV